MERCKLYIYTRNKSYGEKLARALAGRHNPLVEVELLTEFRDKTDFGDNACVVSDDRRLLEKLICQTGLACRTGPACRTVCLVGTPEAVGEGDIFMYQEREAVCDSLLRAVLGKNAANGEWGTIRKGGDYETRRPEKLICIFSPEESGAAVAYSLRRAARLAERARVLYVSLSGFPALFGEEACGSVQAGREGVTELMLSPDAESFRERLGELTFPVDSFHALAPAGHFRDLLDFTADEVLRFAENLREQKIYDVVLIATGQLYEFTFALFAAADRVIVPEEDGYFAENRRRVLKACFAREGLAELWDKLEFVRADTRAPRTWEEVLRPGGE